MDAATLEAEALWGNDIKEKAIEFRMCVRSLQVDIQSFIQGKFSGGRSCGNDKLINKINNAIWDTNSEDNELTKRINMAIEALESEIRPHLSRNS